MRLMWWTNPAYWSVQGEVWAQASKDKDSDVGRWFSWGPEDCTGITACDSPGVAVDPSANIVVPGVGCAQGSWRSDGANDGFHASHLEHHPVLTKDTVRVFP